MTYDGTIMANLPPVENHIRSRRTRRGWSQEELARRSGLSRAGISAIERGRIIPSAAAALTLAAALECRVEDLFTLRRPEPQEPRWAWAPAREPCRYWTAEVDGVERHYPTAATPMVMVPHDGIYRDGSWQGHERWDPRRTLVMACCDPAVGLLAAELARTADVRLIALHYPSRMALTLLGRGLVHAAGVHLTRAGQPGGNARVVRSELGAGYKLLRIARWEEGITFAPGRRLPSVRAAAQSDLCWIGREDGSGARQCLDEVLVGRRVVPRFMASDHRGVAEAVRSGCADAGVCLRLVSEEAGLDFLGVREEAYDLCFPARWEKDPRIRALLEVVRSPAYRKALGELPGYDSAETGELQHVSS
jgi:molybdate-binding protein/transcriptional regulator with XRE-family HTH domain